MPQNDRPPEPWRSFFAELDELVPEPVELHCFDAYGVARTTNDADFLSLVPRPLRQTLTELGGVGSALHEKHKVYLAKASHTDPVANSHQRQDGFFSPEDPCIILISRNTQWGFRV
jgi:hypothetical protein